MNSLIYNFIYAALVLLAAIIGRYAVPYLYSKINAEQLSIITTIVESAVLASQQLLWDKTGEERKAYATQKITEYLNEKNIKITEDQLSDLIEAAVKQMNISSGKTYETEASQ